jgi:hypothetical protein
VLSKVFTADGQGRELFPAVERLDLEGLVAKRKVDLYAPSTAWYKDRVYTQMEGEVSFSIRHAIGPAGCIAGMIQYRPPADYPHITAVDERACPGRDPRCYFEMINDVGDGMATLLQPSSWSAGKDNVVVKPLTGELKVSGQLSHVVIGPADPT